MTTLESTPVIPALCFWGYKLANKKVLFHIDNQALVTIINKQTSKFKRVMFLLRPFIMKCMLNVILFKAVYKPTKSNSIVDSISRKQWQRFQQVAPQAQTRPLIAPDDFQHLIYRLKYPCSFRHQSPKIHKRRTRTKQVYRLITSLVIVHSTTSGLPLQILLFNLLHIYL